MVWIFLGPPGAGKGTQAVLLAEHLGVPHVSTGDLLRSAVTRGTELGRRVQNVMSSGELVPDDMVLDLVREVLAGAPGCILDGFPRTVVQADGLGTLLAGLKLELKGVLLLDVTDEVLVERLARRAQAEDRPDDSEETVRNRLRVYEEQTAPLIDYYRKLGRLIDVAGEGSIEEIQARIRKTVARVTGGSGT